MEGIVRIIKENGRQPTFVDELERRARSVAREREREAELSSPVGIIQGEIALTLDQIKRMRQIHEQQEHSLRRSECYIDTELMQMELRTPRYSPYRYPEREKLQRRPQQIQHERMHFAVRESAELRELHRRLLYSINEHTHLRRRWTSKDSPGN